MDVTQNIFMSISLFFMMNEMERGMEMIRWRGEKDGTAFARE